MSATTATARVADVGRYKPYPMYKSSGIEWLGELPAHWDVRLLKRIVEFRGGGTPSKDNGEYWRGEIPWVSPKDMKVSLIMDTEDKITSNAIRESATKLIPRGAVLIVVRSGILAHSIPVALAGRVVTLNQDLKAMIPSSAVAARYLMYFIAGMQRELLTEWRKEGATVESLELETVACTPAPLPFISEQCAIADFLDRETARIDALAAKNERLISLLEEQRTALISQAVTKGLHLNVPMKDSGVEWLGEIPADWEVKRLKHLARVDNSGAYGSEPGASAIDLPVCTTAHITVDGRFLVDEMPVRGFSRGEAAYYVGAPGDIFVVKSSGSNTNIVSGKLGLVRETTPKIVFSNFLLRIRPYRNFALPDFLAYLLRSELTRERIQRMVATTTYPNIDVPEYVGSALAIPPIGEQERIAAFLDHEMARIDALLAKVGEAIERLCELRSALISAAVRGRIDVREKAA